MKKELSTSISDFKIIVSENAKTGFIKEILNNFKNYNKIKIILLDKIKKRVTIVM